MDYIPVYEGDTADDAGGLTISLGRVQRAGVRTEPVETHVMVQPVRSVGTVVVDERRLTVVSLAHRRLYRGTVRQYDRPDGSGGAIRCSASTPPRFSRPRLIFWSPWAPTSAG